ncbi:hypothetical protein Glove_227g85 [Diversispora epigaea]|uniref:Uncharacterized protein n=1 Tax=Diversispora epigaea TaxID=1348612 RepID=A0A397IMG0_9GLOM|nr:hypothetical protein Glove_227g85 [Diversispora epigaea]
MTEITIDNDDNNNNKDDDNNNNNNNNMIKERNKSERNYQFIFSLLAPQYEIYYIEMTIDNDDNNNNKDDDNNNNNNNNMIKERNKSERNYQFIFSLLAPQYEIYYIEMVLSIENIE